MALPPSGTISLSQIQTEFGGANPISISEYYGAASGVPTSGAISISNFHGTSSITYIDTQYVTVEYQPAGQYNSDQWGYDGYVWMIGSISDGTCNWLSGNDYRGIIYTGSNLSLTVEGTNVNSGFTSMIIKGTTYTRASATYSYTGTSGGRTWRWTTTNPFPTDGEVVTVNFA